MAAQSLGSFGTVHPDAVDVEQDFEYFGSTLRVNPYFSPASYIDFLEAATTMGEGEDPREAVAIKRMLQELLHEEDFERFWTLTKRHRQDAEDLARIVKALMEALTDRPTERPSSSSDGRPSTGPSSAPVDMSRAAAARAALKGRPDMQAGIRPDDLATGTE